MAAEEMIADLFCARVNARRVFDLSCWLFLFILPAKQYEPNLCFSEHLLRPDLFK
jgi:hypothetical protein